MAERTADEFIAQLLPKLKAVDDRREKEAAADKVIHFPNLRLRPAWAGLAAAAALAGLMVIPLLLTHQAEAMAMVMHVMEENCLDSLYRVKKVRRALRDSE